MRWNLCKIIPFLNSSVEFRRVIFESWVYTDDLDSGAFFIHKAKPSGIESRRPGFDALDSGYFFAYFVIILYVFIERRLVEVAIRVNLYMPEICACKLVYYDVERAGSPANRHRGESETNDHSQYCKQTPPFLSQYISERHLKQHNRLPFLLKISQGEYILVERYIELDLQIAYDGLLPFLVLRD